MKRLALLALAGAILAGCGGSSNLSKSAYEQKLQADDRAVQETITALTKTPTSSIAQFTTKIDAADAALKKAADELDSIKAPSDAVADNAAIVSGLRAIQAGLEKVKAHPTAALTIVGQLERSPQLKAAAMATADLKQKGYKVGVIGAP